MRDFNSSSTEKIYLFIGAIAGGLLTLLLIRHFPPSQSAVVSAAAIALLSFLSTQINRPTLWWVGIGTIAGIIIGLAVVLEGNLVEQDVVLAFRTRLLILSLQALSGILSGAILGRKLHRPGVPTLKEFLSRVSALTAGLFAIVVTTSYLWEGVEVARTVSSRLSATTTVLVTALILPGIASYLLFERDSLPPSNAFRH